MDKENIIKERHHGDDANIVGNIDSAVYNDGSSVLEQKADSSETGPGVTVFAPGTDIMSACSNTIVCPERLII